MTTDSMTTTAFDPLVQSLRGEVILPDHPEYDAARRVYNGIIDRHPAAIARCRDAADVRACVGFARDRSIELAVRGGAHNAGGLGVWDDALVIDLSAMRTVALSPVDGTVRVDPGCTWAEVDHATVPFGLVIPAGFVRFHRSERPNPRRRCLRLPGSQVRPYGRQSRCLPMLSWPTAASSLPASLPTRTCSGHCEAAAETSASSRRSRSSPTRSGRTASCTPAPCSTTLTTPPR